MSLLSVGSFSSGCLIDMSWKDVMKIDKQRLYQMTIENKERLDELLDVVLRTQAHQVDWHVEQGYSREEAEKRVESKYSMKTKEIEQQLEENRKNLERYIREATQ